MNTARFTNAILSVTTVLALTGCATNQAAKLAEGDRQFKAQEYALPLNAQQTNSPVAKVRVASVKIDGKDLPVNPDSWRALEIRTSITNFVGALARELGPGNTSAMGGEPVQISVSFDGTESTHAGGAFAKGFATGFFTLGLLGHVAPGVYSYRSKVGVSASDPAGKKRAYSAESQEVTVKYDMNQKNAGAQASSTARRQADDESLQKIASQMVREGFFR